LRTITHTALILIVGLVVPAHAYDLTQEIQKDLVALGYDPGNVDGEATTQTVVAIATFEAEHDLEVTGQVTPQLAGILAAEVSNRILAAEVSNNSESEAAVTAVPDAKAPATVGVTVSESGSDIEPVVAATEVTTPAPEEAPDPEALEAAQQKCIQEKVAEAQKARKKQQGFGSLVSAVSRTAGQLGNDDIANTAGTVYDANATAADLSAAAKDLGLTEDDIAACENPG
jgi:peptidoglycan hydrolase-like protein with peptidoglycan-binding domain